MYPLEPIYITEEVRSCVPPGTVLHTRDEFRQTAGWLPIDFRDAYRTCHIAADAGWVALMSPTECRGLPRSVREQLMQVQWQLGRAQIYDWNRVKAEVPGAARMLMDGDRFATPEGEKVALRHDVWQSLPVTIRRRWLYRFVTRQAGPLSHVGLIGVHTPVVQALAGAFAPASGPNCFATALACATDEVARALSIANLWLTQEPFLRGLRERGLQERPFPAAPADVPPGAVVVWSDGQGLPQHACYVIGGELVLNKQAQSWWAPHMVVRLADVMQSWSDGFRLTVWSK